MNSYPNVERTRDREKGKVATSPYVNIKIHLRVAQAQARIPCNINQSLYFLVLFKT